MSSELPLCECACGQKVSKVGNRFVHNHHMRGEDFHKKKIQKLCKCGCGELTNHGNNYIRGHNRRGKHHTQEAIKKNSNAHLGIPKPPRTDTHCIALSKSLMGIPFSPEHIAAFTKAIRNSDSHKKSMKKQKGGNDIVNHHYIYDHAHPKLYTIKVTRKKHGQIHIWMKKSKIKVPHINENIGKWRYSNDR